MATGPEAKVSLSNLTPNSRGTITGNKPGWCLSTLSRCDAEVDPSDCTFRSCESRDKGELVPKQTKDEQHDEQHTCEYVYFAHILNPQRLLWVHYW
jgi:hypothetical protein